MLKLETLAEDSSWLLRRLNLSDKTEDWRRVVGTGGTGAHVGPGGAGDKAPPNLSRKYFKQISGVKLKMLYDKYKLDFQLFDYSMKEFFGE